MQRFLACCEEIEQAVADVYRHWQQVYRDDQEFADLWRVLADDELAHVSQIKLARTLPANSVFSGKGVAVKDIDNLLARARKLLADVQKVTLSKETALRTAIKMEKAFNKVHVENIGEFTNPSMRAMFTSLARDDAEHMATLQTYYDKVIETP